MVSLQQSSDWLSPYRKRLFAPWHSAAAGLAPPARRPLHEVAKTSAAHCVSKGQPAARRSRRDSSIAFCPHCYALITAGDAQCPICGADLQEWHAKGYVERLVLALNHPLADVRMRAIIALGWRRESAAERALVDCALHHPSDVVAGLEIITSLRLLSEDAPNRDGLMQLAHSHPARAVRQAARLALQNAQEPK